MTFGIVAIVMGAVFLVAVAADILRLKKMSSKIRAVISVIGILILAVGSGMILSYQAKQKQASKTIYLALSYLEIGYPDQTIYHLNQLSEKNAVALATEVLAEHMRGNTSIAQFKFEILQQDDTMQSIKQDLAACMSVAPEMVSTEKEVLLEKLKDKAGLSKKEKQEVASQLYQESGMQTEDFDGKIDYTQQRDSLIFSINQSLLHKQYDSALQLATELVTQKSNAKNTLLLAEIVAECMYANSESIEDILTDGNEKAQEQIEKEKESLQEDIDRLQDAMDDYQMNPEADPEEKKQVATDLQNAEQKQQNIMAYRALNSIADIYSLQADIVRAKLYYAMRQNDKAIEQLYQTASSIKTMLSATPQVKDAFAVLQQATSNTSTMDTSLIGIQNNVQTILSASSYDLSGAASSNLTKDFSAYVESNLKEYGVNLYVSQLDYSQFPNITVQLSGKQEILDKIYNSTNTTVKDTKTPVAYTMQYINLEESGASSNVYCLADQSTSMNGEPLDNLKLALSEFVSTVGEKSKIGLIGFSDTAMVHSTLTQDTVSLNSQIEALETIGGTNIEAGILEAVKQFENVGGERIVLLMTDGQSSVQSSVLQQAKDANVKIYAIGFGDVQDQLLQQIADETGGQYIKAENSNELQAIYRSLGSAIGKSLELTYTAPDNGEKSRYFFIKTEDGTQSAKVDYLLQPKEVPTALWQVNPGTITLEELQYYAEQDAAAIELQLYGKGLEHIQQITIGTMPVQEIKMQQAYSNNESYMTVTVPTQSLVTGWNPIELTLKDGTVLTYDNMLAVGDSFDGRNFALGNLGIFCYNPLLLPDGTLVFPNGTSIYNIVPDTMPIEEQQKQSKLSLRISSGYIQTDVATLQSQLQNNTTGTISLDATATLQGTGRVSLDYNDSAQVSNAPYYLVSGPFEIQSSGIDTIVSK